MSVKDKHPEYDEYAVKWQRCRDVFAGQDKVHAAGPLYLPRLIDQEEDDYKAYVVRATFYNASYRTVVGLAGMIFRQPPKVVVPDPVIPFLDDITLSGVPFNTFVDDVTKEALQIGRVGVFVDYPTADAAVATLADAKTKNLRPSIVRYCAESIINWRTRSINNKSVLSLVVLEEKEEVVVDEFHSKWETRYRVLDLTDTGQYRVRIFKIIKDQDVQIGGDIYPQMNGKTLDYIPFIFVGVEELTSDLDLPPLIDLVDLNLSHYRTTADYEHGAHFTGLPTPVITGFTPEDATKKIYIGSQSAWVFPKADAKAFYLEFSGDGLKTLETMLTRKEAQMAILGARMLEPQKRGVESADSVAIHRKGEDSMLASVAQTLSIAIEKALDWFVEWCGIQVVEGGKEDAEAVQFDLNRDFYPVPMSPQMLTSLMSMWQQGAISKQTLFKNLQQGEVIDQDATFEDEETKIEDEQAHLMQQAADAAALSAGAVSDATGGGNNPAQNGG